MPPSAVPKNVPMPWERPHRLITSPRRFGLIRSLTTEKPTELTAPRPTAADTWEKKKREYVPASALPVMPAAQSSVPIISSGLRLPRSP